MSPYQIEQLKAINTRMIERAIKVDAPKTQRNKLNSLRTSIEYLYEANGVRYLLDYDYDDMEDLFHWINSTKMIRKKSKTRYRYHLKSVFMYAIKQSFQKKRKPAPIDSSILEDLNLDKIPEDNREDEPKNDLLESIGDQKLDYMNQIGFWKYIFSDDFYKFKETGTKREILYLTPEDIKIFIQELKHKPEDYIFFGTILFSGCRIGGLCALLIKNINWEKGTFQTQEKPTAASSGFNTYYLPKFFMDDLYHFIQSNNLSSNDYLVDVTDKAIRHRLKKYREDWWPHLLRHTLRTCWAQKGMKPIIAKYLLNHEPETVDETYQQSLNNPGELRKEYDRCFPY